MVTINSTAKWIRTFGWVYGVLVTACIAWRLATCRLRERPGTIWSGEDCIVSLFILLLHVPLFILLDRQFSITIFFSHICTF